MRSTIKPAGGKRFHRLCVLGAGAVLATPVLAGAPFLTDDPDTLAPGHWEFNTTVTGTRSDAGRDGVAPEFELNYGAAPDFQWHMQVPVAGHADAGRHLRYGLGDVELGIKYRFVQEDAHGWRPMVGVTPAIDFPTGDARRSLGSGHTRMALPLWVQKSVGEWTSSAGGGWYSNPGAGNRNYVFVGWMVQRQLSDRLALGAEVFHQGADQVGGVGTSGYNVGAVLDLDEHHHLLLSAGRGLSHVAQTNRFSFFVQYRLSY